MRNGWIVITTINPPNKIVRDIIRRCARRWTILIVGDSKTPEDWASEDVVFLDVNKQKKLFPVLSKMAPLKHYSRKNFGYLYAMKEGAEVILDIDDDGRPHANFGKDFALEVGGRLLSQPGPVNIFPHFTSQKNVWPRGLPLDAIHMQGSLSPLKGKVKSPIQQYLIDGDTDYDAIHRLVLNQNVYFKRDIPPVVLGPQSRSPFNSQNTVFFPAAFPLMYLPAYVPFRLTDIWRSFVAQEALSRHGYALSFHPSTMEQLRNPHNLMDDFESEMNGYRYNRAIIERLRALPVKRETMSETAARCWEELCKAGFIEKKEVRLFNLWLK